VRVSRPVRTALGRTPHVEVVIPCHNYGHFLAGCVESVIRQLGVRTSVTIVDDASTDDSADIGERLARTHREVRLIRNDTNLGAVRTFNVGLARADSDYVVLLSADDLLAPGSLARATALMEARPSVGLVFGHAQKFATHPVPHPARPAVTWTTWRGEEWIERQLRRAWNNISSPEAVVRTYVQHEAGYYDPGLPRTHDVEMWLRIAALADVGHINGVEQAYYRRHEASHSSQFSASQDAEERWRAYDQFLSRWTQAEPAVRLRSIAQRRLSDEVLFDLLRELDRGDVTEQTITGVLEVAARIDPDVVGRGQWADVQAGRSGTHRPSAAALTRTAGRELARLARWHRWRRFRYLG